MSNLSYVDPECTEECHTKLTLVSGFKAGQAYNEICRLIGGYWPDCKLQEEAPNAHEFFMTLFGCGKQDD